MNEFEQMLIDGLKELTSSFEVMIPDSDILRKVKEILNPPLEILPPPQVPAQGPLSSYTYWKDDDINGDIFHIAENILKIDLESCTIKEKAMAMKMARIERNGKSASFVQKDYLAVLGLNKKELANLFLELEQEHGKYHTKSALMKVKYDTTSVYDKEHMDKVVNFAFNFFEESA